MILLLIKNKKKYPRPFMIALRTIFKNRFLLLVQKEKLLEMETKIKEKYNIPRFDLYNICINSIENSIIIEGNDDYTLNIDPNMRFNNLKIASVIKYINDGDLETIPYPIFTEVRQYIEVNLDKLYSLYEMGIIV